VQVQENLVPELLQAPLFWHGAESHGSAAVKAQDRMQMRLRRSSGSSVRPEQGMAYGKTVNVMIPVPRASVQYHSPFLMRSFTALTNFASERASAIVPHRFSNLKNCQQACHQYSQAINTHP
jgi:hypothetical protein